MLTSYPRTRTHEQSITQPIHAVHGDGEDYQVIEMDLLNKISSLSQVTSPQNVLSGDSLSIIESDTLQEITKKRNELRALEAKIADLEKGEKLASMVPPPGVVVVDTSSFPQMAYPAQTGFPVNGDLKDFLAEKPVDRKRVKKESIDDDNLEKDGSENGEDGELNEDDEDDDDDDDENNQDANQNEDGKIKNVKTKASIHSSSSLQLEDYFNQDIEKRTEEQFKKIVNDITRFKSYFVKFRFHLFFEFFFYHSLFVMFFGPLANPILYLFGKGLPRNLMFWGMNFGFYYQTFAYTIQVVSLGLYSAFSTPYVKFQSEIIYLFIGMAYRISTIAIKYATFDPTKIRAFKDFTLDLKDVVSDFFLRDWKDQTNRIIYEEIYFAQRMYEIDPSWFYLEFIVSPEKQTIELLESNIKELSKFHTQTDTNFEPQPIHTSSPDNKPYYIYGVIKLLIDSFQKKHGFGIKFVQYFAKGYSILRVLFPTFYKLVQYGSQYLTEASWYEHIISASIAYMSFLFYYFTIWTLLQGVIDMKRKIFLMEQMAFMISPRKLRNIDSEKELPTINIFKSSNLKAWQLMRHVCQEYGKRYDIRVQSYFSGVVIEVVISVIILSLQYTNVIALEQCFIIILLIETVCSLALFILILYHGAQVNEMFDIHDSILNQNKGVLLDIYRMRRRYFCQEFKTTNYLYSKGVQKIREEVKYLQLENPCAHIKEIVDAYDTHIDELRFDQTQNPFQIGSITITNGMLESGVIGVASIAIAIVAKYLSTRFDSSSTTRFD